jgi:hypothetical protein
MISILLLLVTCEKWKLKKYVLAAAACQSLIAADYRALLASCY